MTRTDRLKLAKAARELASDFVEGHGPLLNPGTWCLCAAGQLFVRSGVPNSVDRKSYRMAAEDLDVEFGGVLTDATNAQTAVSAEARIPGAVVFPLLWLADELESQP